MSKWIILFLFSGWLGCSQQPITLEELKSYPLIEANGILKSHKKGEVQLAMYYKPKDLLIAQELRIDANRERLEELKAQYDSLDYFILKISKNGQEIENSYASNPEQFEKAVNYLSGSLGQKIVMINDRDTIPVLDVVYVRSFGATKATQVMPVFKSNLSARSGTVRVLFNDDYLGTGLSQFDFEIRNIKKIPKLNFEQL
jgi:hypothetical protein